LTYDPGSSGALSYLEAAREMHCAASRRHDVEYEPQGEYSEHNPHMSEGSSE